MNTTATFSAIPLQPAKLALFGHNGVAHAVSHLGFQQDDSVGFAQLFNILCKAIPIDTTVRSIKTEGNNITVELASGEKGSAAVNRGIAKYERELLKHSEGLCDLSPQHFAIRTFGRIYGQGISEACTALNLAYSRAILNTVRKFWPETMHDFDNVPNSCGEFLAGCILINDIPVCWMLTINSSEGGIGPNEDSEGNIPVGNKGIIMEKLGMRKIPSLILEGKAYVPALKDQIKATSFFLRWHKDSDNRIVGNAMVNAAQALNLPYMVIDTAYARNDPYLVNESRRVGKKLIELGEQYMKCETSAQRVSIAYEVAKIASEDFGGSIFMSDKIYQTVAGGGLFPGLSAVLSIIVPEEHISQNHQIVYERSDTDNGCILIVKTLENIMQNYQEAIDELNARTLHTSPSTLLDWTIPN